MKDILEAAVIGESPFANQLRKMLPRIAAVDAPVFLTGPTGVGKTFLAQIIHQLSPRKVKPFLKVNCTNIPVTLMESELFGHIKGAFTGAYSDRIGVFQAANEGTLFLDEIAEIPPEVQAKLLTVIESKQFSPVGSTEVINVDVRIIAATNKPIASALKNGDLRSDLFYRLNTFTIDILPLSQRPEDIPHVIEVLKRQLENRYRRQLTIPRETMRWLQELMWPGNMREIKHFLERVIVSQVDILTPAIARQHLSSYGEDGPLTLKKIVPLKAAIASYIKQVVALTETKNQAARLLGIDIKTLNKYLNYETTPAKKTGDN